MTTDDTTTSKATSEILQQFGLYKAEWHDRQLFDHFTEPEYLRELAGRRPCVLIGGRGTGKTTVLRGLSFEGQFLLHRQPRRPLDSVAFIGLYYRVNTNRVMAFLGPELTEAEWVKYFGHYVNLTLCGLVLEFLTWYERQTSTSFAIPQRSLRRIAAALHLPECVDLLSLAQELDDARLRFESAINNVASGARPVLSMLGVPIDEIVTTTLNIDCFKGKQIFFLLDEYENFQNYQQQVLNTVIKQASDAYVFKIGVRELGWRERSTLNANEQLTHPADYVRLDLREQLTGDPFRRFATSVCNSRLDRIRNEYPEVIGSVERALPDLTEEAEAALLGVEDSLEEILRELRCEPEDPLSLFAGTLSPLELYFVRFWSEAGNGSLTELLQDWMVKPDEWQTRLGNYLHASLFSIRRGKRGIRKFYSGWQTFLLLSDGNIRYLLQLVHASFEYQFAAGGSVADDISPENQTKAAQRVGRGNLDELEGLSVEGARLTRLLLGLGRVFGVLAERPEGHTPEVNQFRLSASEVHLSASLQASKLLDVAVMHQALVRFKGTKPIDESDTKEYDYMIHPIFAAFFVFSHRRKRKLSLTPEQLLGLVDRHRETIREVLQAQNRPVRSVLPDQLELFEAYYNDGR